MNNIEEILKKVGRPKKKPEDKTTPDRHQYYKNFTSKHNERVECECGGHYTYYAKSNHLKSKIHKKFVLGDKTFLKEQIDKMNQIYQNL